MLFRSPPLQSEEKEALERIEELKVAGRDLKALVDQGLLISQGEKRGRLYIASPVLRELRDRVRESKSIEDPFEALTKSP